MLCIALQGSSRELKAVGQVFGGPAIEPVGEEASVWFAASLSDVEREGNEILVQYFCIS